MGTAPRTRPPHRAADRRGRRAALPLRASVAVAAAFFFLTAGPGRSNERTAIPPGEHVTFTATAYCDTGTTKAGVRTRAGVAAADPAVLPVGSVVRLHGANVPRYEGIYTVMDTGGAVHGHRIDLYVANCREAKEFGLKRVLVRVLRLGWNPRASAPPSNGTP